MPEPIKGVAYTFYIALTDIADPQKFLVNPSISSGDFQISVDGALFVNLTNLPTVTPTGSSAVRVDLTAPEMDAAKVVVKGVDAGNLWGDIFGFLDVPTGNEESIMDVIEGDHVETSTRQTINLKGTSTPVLDKQVTGSLLSPTITITTSEQP